MRLGRGGSWQHHPGAAGFTGGTSRLFWDGANSCCLGAGARASCQWPSTAPVADIWCLLFARFSLLPICRPTSCVTTRWSPSFCLPLTCMDTSSALRTCRYIPNCSFPCFLLTELNVSVLSLTCSPKVLAALNYIVQISGFPLISVSIPTLIAEQAHRRPHLPGGGQ